MENFDEGRLVYLNGKFVREKDAKFLFLTLR